MKIEIDLKTCRGITTENPFEYTIPIEEKDRFEFSQAVGSKHSWISTCAEYSPEELNSVLQERLRLSGSKDGSANAAFAQNAKGKGFVVREGITWIHCQSQVTPKHTCDFLIGEPGSQTESERNIHWIDDNCREEVVDFLVRLRGYREDYDPISGHFLDAENGLVPVNFNEIAMLVSIGDQWEDSRFLFNSRDGALLLLRKDGSTGWLPPGEREVRLFTSTFAEFCERFFRHALGAVSYDEECYYDEEIGCYFTDPFDGYCKHDCCK